MTKRNTADERDREIVANHQPWYSGFDNVRDSVGYVQSDAATRSAAAALARIANRIVRKRKQGEGK